LEDYTVLSIHHSQPYYVSSKYRTPPISSYLCGRYEITRIVLHEKPLTDAGNIQWYQQSPMRILSIASLPSLVKHIACGQHSWIGNLGGWQPENSFEILNGYTPTSKPALITVDSCEGGKQHLRLKTFTEFTLPVRCWLQYH